MSRDIGYLIPLTHAKASKSTLIEKASEHVRPSYSTPCIAMGSNDSRLSTKLYSIAYNSDRVQRILEEFAETRNVTSSGVGREKNERKKDGR